MRRESQRSILPEHRIQCVEVIEDVVHSTPEQLMLYIPMDRRSGIEGRSFGFYLCRERATSWR